MGRITSQPEATINHFSHAHPLKLSNFQPQQNLNEATCSGCKLKASGWIYSCSTCSYFLHMKCSQMPKEINHPFDKNNHVFSLLSKPAYPDGIFNCDACGKHGDGFSYHCKVCNLDLHILCAVLPMSRTHHSHQHELHLAFTPPYADKMFHCDVCKSIGSDHWLYRCHLCRHDVHLDCVDIPQPTHVHMQASVQQVLMPQAATAIPIREAPQPRSPPLFRPQYMAARPPSPMPVMNPLNQGIQAPFMPVGATQNYDMMAALQALQRIQANTTQPRPGQDIFQAILSGGGNGIGNAGPPPGQDIFQAIVSGGGNGIGNAGLPAGQDIFQAILSGGGNGIGNAGLPPGQDIFQAILSGGGNGIGNAGLPNLLQAFTGGNNVGGGLDVLGMGGGSGGGLEILQGLLGGGGGVGIPGVEGLGGINGLLGGFGFL